MSLLLPVISRRHFFGMAALTFSDVALTGCRHNMRIFQTGTLATAPGVPSNSPLTIDVHCHIFNGTDLQIENFLGDVTFPTWWGKAAGEILELVNWNLAPRGEEERAKLQELVNACKSAGGVTKVATAVQEKLAEHRKEGYTRARQAVQAVQAAQAIPQKAPGGGAPAAAPPSADVLPTQDAKQQIFASFDTPDYDTLQQNLKTPAPLTENMTARIAPAIGAVRPPSAMAAASATSQAFSLKGAVDFIIQYFQYRFVSAQDYLNTFTPAAQRDVDLLLASMVDYDWWLAKGNPTPTTLDTQVAVMELISILSDGRVHGFAPFCPLREVAARAGFKNEHGDAAWSSLQFVQAAVRSRGCVGVKLYPPMGFAPYGNAALDDPAHGGNADFWKGGLLPGWASAPIQYPDGTVQSLGQRLDDSLDDLYVWCVQEQVPILAHTEESNGPSDAYKLLASAYYWGLALKKHSDLRVNFGHLGGIDDSIGQAALPTTSQAFAALLGAASSPNAYGDVAFSSNMVLDPAAFDERIQMAYQQALGGTGQLSAHLLYGTDWSLLEQIGNNTAYMKGFETLFSRIDSPACSGHSAQDCFFGWNAVDYLGLRGGAPTKNARSRLEAFYVKHCMPNPMWMRKLDKG